MISRDSSIKQPSKASNTKSNGGQHKIIHCTKEGCTCTKTRMRAAYISRDHKMDQLPVDTVPYDRIPGVACQKSEANHSKYSINLMSQLGGAQNHISFLTFICCIFDFVLH